MSGAEGGSSSRLPRLPHETLTTPDVATSDAGIASFPLKGALVSCQEGVAAIMGETAPVGRSKLGPGHTALQLVPKWRISTLPAFAWVMPSVWNACPPTPPAKSLPPWRLPHALPPLPQQRSSFLFWLPHRLVHSSAQTPAVSASTHIYCARPGLGTETTTSPTPTPQPPPPVSLPGTDMQQARTPHCDENRRLVKAF